MASWGIVYCKWELKKLSLSSTFPACFTQLKFQLFFQNWCMIGLSIFVFAVHNVNTPSYLSVFAFKLVNVLT